MKDKVLNLRNTISQLKYIAESPERQYGGFYDDEILLAKSAMYHIKRLKGVVHEAKRRDQNEDQG